jgi:hypothetical protein
MSVIFNVGNTVGTIDFLNVDASFEWSCISSFHVSVELLEVILAFSYTYIAKIKFLVSSPVFKAMF